MRSMYLKSRYLGLKGETGGVAIPLGPMQGLCAYLKVTWICLGLCSDCSLLGVFDVMFRLRKTILERLGGASKPSSPK